ncbi:hypothetical protein PoB_005494800 [Plakobranchus ocellatus]|uniref:Uncharacterized protein n=1 Tax=Plakobranchus ocellatus TaxID=259542 RepID=A0AAV4CAB3_9GAST|nr:hypothetical protein PoB_005494800 [Plakobranchus ocellatus]
MSIVFSHVITKWEESHQKLTRERLRAQVRETLSRPGPPRWEKQQECPPSVNIHGDEHNANPAVTTATVDTTTTITVWAIREEKQR